MKNWKEVKSWPKGQRVCRACGGLKADGDFHKFKRGAHGRYPICKDCRKPKSKAIDVATRVEVKLLRAAKARAKRLKVPFNIELSDIKIPERCPILGLPLVYKTPYAPSVDRVKPTLGYVKGNIEIISKRANTLKNNGTLEEFKLLVAHLEL